MPTTTMTSWSSATSAVTPNFTSRKRSVIQPMIPSEPTRIRMTACWMRSELTTGADRSSGCACSAIGPNFVLQGGGDRAELALGRHLGVAGRRAGDARCAGRGRGPRRRGIGLAGRRRSGAGAVGARAGRRTRPGLADAPATRSPGAPLGAGLGGDGAGISRRSSLLGPDLDEAAARSRIDGASRPCWAKTASTWSA